MLPGCRSPSREKSNAPLEGHTRRVPGFLPGSGNFSNYLQTSLKSGLRVKISRRFNSFGNGFLKPE